MLIKKEQTHINTYQTRKLELEGRKKTADESIMLYKKNKAHNTRQLDNILKMKEESDKDCNKAALKYTNMYNADQKLTG